MNDAQYGFVHNSQLCDSARREMFPLEWKTFQSTRPQMVNHMTGDSWGEKGAEF